MAKDPPGGANEPPAARRMETQSRHTHYGTLGLPHIEKHSEPSTFMSRVFKQGHFVVHLFASLMYPYDSAAI